MSDTQCKISCSLFSCLTRNKSIIRSNNEDVNRSIEKHMKVSKKEEENTLRVLLLGPGSSGKTTFLKQITKIYNNDDKKLLINCKNVAKPIQNAVIEYMKILCKESVILHQQNGFNTLIDPQFEYIAQSILNLSSPHHLTDEIAFKIKTLWNDEGIKETLKKRHYFQIHDNVSYFLNKISAISSTDYVPSFDDYLRFRCVTTGFAQSNILIDCSKLGNHMFEFTDVGGQRSERKKWMRFVKDDIDAVLYILAISEYDLTLFEDSKTNRLVEAIDLFGEIMAKGKFFTGKSVLIFFNKYDLFKKKIKKTPITVAFDDFPVDDMNPNDVDDVIRFVASKFLHVFQEQQIELTSPLHIVRTTALNTNIVKKIMSDITMDLIQESLKDVCFM